MSTAPVSWSDNGINTIVLILFVSIATKPSQSRRTGGNEIRTKTQTEREKWKKCTQSQCDVCVREKIYLPRPKFCARCMINVRVIRVCRLNLFHLSFYQPYSSVVFVLFCYHKSSRGYVFLEPPIMPVGTLLPSSPSSVCTLWLLNDFNYPLSAQLSHFWFFLPIEKEPPPPPLPVFGRRRGGKILKTGMVKKVRPIEESAADAPNDAWTLYLQEVKKYKSASCDADSKTRPLVK